MRTRLLVLMVATASARLSLAQPQRYDRVLVVPAPKAVVLDGDLGDWDLSAALDCLFDEALAPRFTARVAFLYDAKAFYIGAHFVDDTPLLNRHDPAVEPDRGWAGDCLQVRLCSDPAAPYPLPDSNSDRICHLTMWYFTDRQLPVLQVQYGMDYHGTKIWTGAQSGLAFRKDREGKGYALEARIPWERLNAAANPPRADDRIALVVQPLWSDGSGWKQVLTFNDVVREAGFSFQGTGMWGQAIFSPRGHLPPTAGPRRAEQAAQPLTLALRLPDRAAKSVSAAVYDAAGQLLRTLPVTRLSSPAERGSLAMSWDGLDDEGRPLPPGPYIVKMLTHRGIGQKWVASLHNAGNPPWRTDDGTGSWGGDHGPPIAAASDGERVYLGWTISEAGWAVIGLETGFTPDGKVRKLWGQHQVLEIGMLVTALASDGERLFVAQDGRTWGAGSDPNIPNKAGVVIWEAKTGKPINFPFGQRVLAVSKWLDALKPKDKPFWNRMRDGDFGPQELGLNLLGIAVAGDTLYASLYLEDKVVAFDWRTGHKAREYAVPKPVGLAATADGSVLAVSGQRIVRLDPQSTQVTPVVTAGLSAPWGVALDAQGRMYATDCGKAMQVKAFDAAGKPLGAIGKAGGRPWVGAYDASRLLRPAGLTVDHEGKVWVAEQDDTPRRVSVWSQDGKLVADLLGPGAYAVEGIADQQNPRWVNVHLSLFDVDYATGRWRTLATLIRPRMHGLELLPSGGGMGRALQFAHVRGQTFVTYPGYHVELIYRLGEDFVAKPVAALGWAKDLPVFGIQKDDLPAAVREQVWADRSAYGFCWTDTNGDGVLQPDEFVFERVPQLWGNYWGSWVDEDLTIWCNGATGPAALWRVPVKEWLPSGVPVYPKPSEQQPLFTVPGNPRLEGVMPGQDGVYVLEQQGGDAYGKGAKWQAISRYTLAGKRLWAYRRVWLGFGLEAPLSQPGDVVGAMKFVGKARLDNGLELVAVNGYFGQFNLLCQDGLWVESLCKDNRYGPPADATTVWPENFSGCFFRNRDNGKAYLIAGDTDARIWEVTGLETIRTAQAEVTLTEADHQAALQVALRRQGLTSELAPLRLRRVPAPRIDGNLGDWEMSAALTIEAGGGRSAKVALAYDDTHLLAAFDVRDDSPMKNSGQDFALLFKTGDACQVMLGADPTADPKRTRPGRGDLRLLFSVLEGQPVCVLYQPVMGEGERAPRLFGSPTGAELFDRVVSLEGSQVEIARTTGGYTLEAAVPLAGLSFAPKPGMLLKGDVGVIFSDPGGSRDVLRVCYADKDTAIVNDIPTEARLEPAKWGMVQVE